MSLPEMAKIYGVHVKTVWRWMKKHGVPRRDRDKAKFEKYYKNEKPVDFGNRKDLAYVLGVMYGDGSLVFNPKTYGYILKLACKEEAFAHSFAEALKRLGVKPYIWHSKKTGVWEVRGLNKRLWLFIKQVREDETLKMLEETVRGHDLEFVRGFYESEGTNQALYFTNTREDVLRFVAKILEAYGFTVTLHSYSPKIPKRKKIYRLYVLGGKKARRRFLYLVRPKIKRGGI